MIRNKKPSFQHLDNFILLCVFVYVFTCFFASRGRAGREYYGSICMRAVNQSIGRSIRHAGDYASILLVDERYKDDQVGTKPLQLLLTEIYVLQQSYRPTACSYTALFGWFG